MENNVIGYAVWLKSGHILETKTEQEAEALMDKNPESFVVPIVNTELSYFVQREDAESMVQDLLEEF